MAQTITLGGGCFWCLEAAFQDLEGVEEALPGYAGGHKEDPTYEEVCTGTTGHAEVVQVRFDPDVIPLRTILEAFFSVHDPTTKDRQGADVGPQYRSIILHGEGQRAVAEDVMREADEALGGGLVTELLPLERFWPAEEHHRDYYRRNPDQAYCAMVVQPKLAKFRRRWQERMRTA